VRRIIIVWRLIISFIAVVPAVVHAGWGWHEIDSLELAVADAQVVVRGRLVVDQIASFGETGVVIIPHEVLKGEVPLDVPLRVAYDAALNVKGESVLAFLVPRPRAQHASPSALPLCLRPDHGHWGLIYLDADKLRVPAMDGRVLSSANDVLDATREALKHPPSQPLRYVRIEYAFYRTPLWKGLQRVSAVNLPVDSRLEQLGGQWLMHEDTARFGFTALRPFPSRENAKLLAELVNTPVEERWSYGGEGRRFVKTQLFKEEAWDHFASGVCRSIARCFAFRTTITGRFRLSC
jgi:hypothetical protein